MKAQFKALLALQDIDLALEAIEKKRGMLPERIGELTKELDALEEKKEIKKKEIQDQEAAIESHREEKKKLESLLEKYRKDQLAATEKREYNDIGREVALQELEVRLVQKKIRETQQVVKEYKEQLSSVRAEIRDKKDKVKNYKADLECVQKEVEEEETKLREAHSKAVTKVPEDLCDAYEAMAEYLGSPRVVVYVEKESCGGCRFHVPSQKQVMILEGKRMVRCEYCNRILVGVIEEEVAPLKRR